MVMSTDTDLLALMPDVLELGIDSFTLDHSRAQADIERQLRVDWWNSTGRSGEMNTSLLTESQFTRACIYRALGWYILPKLAKWQPDDRFTAMMDHYRSEYADEMAFILQDGVEYDADDDGVIEIVEKLQTHFARLQR